MKSLFTVEPHLIFFCELRPPAGETKKRIQNRCGCNRASLHMLRERGATSRPACSLASRAAAGSPQGDPAFSRAQAQHCAPPPRAQWSPEWCPGCSRRPCPVPSSHLAPAWRARRGPSLTPGGIMPGQSPQGCEPQCPNPWAGTGGGSAGSCGQHNPRSPASSRRLPRAPPQPR